MPRTARWKTLAGALLASVGALSVVACRNHPPSDHVSRRFDELLGPTSEAAGASTAGVARVRVEDEIRPVVAQAEAVFHAPSVQPATPGWLTSRAPELDGLVGALPVLHATVRHPDGGWQVRDALVKGTEKERLAAVEFLDSDVGQSEELVVTAWVPPSTLDATTAPFTVPAHARLRFGIVVRSVPPVGAEFTVSVQAKDGAPAQLFRRAIPAGAAQDARTWQDIVLPLEAYAGRTVQLRFQANVTVNMAVENAALLLPKALISAPELIVPDEQVDARYNVVLVSIDTLRADHVGAYGYRRPTSPNIDRVAAAGTVFENVMAAWPETSGSHMTLFTGLYPSVHHVAIFAWPGSTLPPWEITLAEVFRQAGYVTGAITEDGALTVHAGFPRGFARYREFPPQNVQGTVFTRHPIDGMLTAANATAEAEKVFALARDWLERYQRDRFFLFLHTYQVHQRNAPGARYDALRRSFVNDHATPTIERADNILATYDAAIAYTDEQLSGVLRALDDLKLTQRTLLIITSDHGEEFFEHGIQGHGQTLYDPAMRVPLVLYSPGLVPSGTRIATPIGLIDLAPTLLEMLRLPALGQAQGRSAAAMLSGAVLPPRPPIFGELGDQWRAVWQDGTKLMRVERPDGAQLDFFDLLQDPGELHPLSVDQDARAQASLRALAEHDLASQALREQLQAAAGGRQPTVTRIDAETRSRMHALGYDVPEAR